MDMDTNYVYCGFEKNPALSLPWYKKAALQGDKGAEGELGYMADNGIGMAPNQDEAVDWYKKAAAQGDKYSIGRLKDLGITFP